MIKLVQYVLGQDDAGPLPRNWSEGVVVPFEAIANK
jgi:hypothetical protein